MTDDVNRTLRDAYDRRAAQRDLRPSPAWELAERDVFAALLEREGKRTLLEVGAATGVSAAAFRSRGFDVVCVDLSQEMVARCRARGLVAHVMDVAHLDFAAETFDAVYAMNCLIHVPKAGLALALEGIDRVLRPGGLVYVGQYGGRDFEGVPDADDFEPKRFFAHYTDDGLQAAFGRSFEVCSFVRIPRGWDGYHFQSLVGRKRT